MSDLPAGWVETTIGEVVEPKVEQHTPLADEHFYYIDISSIDRTAKKIVNPQKLSGKDAPSRARQVVASGDVLVSMTRPNLNAVAMVSDDLDKQIASTGFDVLRAKDVDSRWLYYLVRTNDFVTAMSDLVQGALYPAVRPRDIRDFEIPLAPLDEQKRIAEKLDALLARVDSCQSHLERVPQILKRFRQSVLAAAFHGELTERDSNDEPVSVLLTRLQTERRAKSKKTDEPELPDTLDLPELPDGWAYTLLYPLLSLTRRGMKTGPFGSALKKSDHIQKGVPVLGIENIGRAKFIPGSKIHISKAKAEQLSEYDAVSGDILISRSGTVGEVCVVPENIGDARISTNLIRLSLEPNGMLPQFFCLLFNGSPFVLNQVDDLCKGSTRPFLNQTILSSIVFPIPPLAEQQRIIAVVEQLFAYAERLEARYLSASERVERLTPSLLAKAFRGELVGQDPNDESASALVGRIRKTRDAQKADPSVKSKKSKETDRWKDSCRHGRKTSQKLIARTKRTRLVRVQGKIETLSA